jgi:predicted dehydrogenase
MNTAKPITQIRAGVIGTGFIGPVHIEALRRLGIPVVALCDLPGRVQKAAAKLAIPLVFSDYREMLRSPEVDVVHITAPNRFHCEMALAALRAKTIFAVNYNLRFYPAVLQLRMLVQQGELGEIIHVNGSYMQDWLFKDTDYNWRLLPKEGGKLRAVADIGTHWLDMAGFILGSEIGSVFADLVTWHKTRKRPLGEIETFAKAKPDQRYASYAVATEDCANVLLRFNNGASGNLAVSQVAAGRKNSIRIEVYGSKKSAWWCSEQPETLSFGERDRPNEVSFRGTPAFGPEVSRFIDYPAGHVEGFPDTFKMLFRAVYSAIAGIPGELPFARAEDGHQEVALCEAIAESHRKRSWIKVSVSNKGSVRKKR